MSRVRASMMFQRCFLALRRAVARLLVAVPRDRAAGDDEIFRAGRVLNCPPYGFWNALPRAWQARPDLQQVPRRPA